MSTTVRVVVTPLAPAEDGWQVTYLDKGGAELAPARPLGRSGETPWTFPLPPAAEVDAIDAAQPHHALCTATDEDPLIQALASLAGREPGAKSLIPMGRYLFQVLLGDAWTNVRHDSLRLELEWSAKEAAFHRFPWEILHDGDGFLALQGGVTLLRRVPGPATALASATTPLDVLFVVGRSLRDDVIRPAAEYLGLTQHLKALGIDRQLRPRLLLEASTDCLAAALAQQRPAVVHVIAHGRLEAGRAYIELDAKQGQGVDNVFADSFLELLKDDDHPPPVVVLSACETGVALDSVQRGEASAPFAAELVAGGVPLVVGMTGPVGDLACRLFARAFYSALLSGSDAAEATAAGRRAAVQHGGYDPLSAYDWALPTLFVSSSLKEARLDVQEAPLAAERQRLSRELHPGGYPAFCDRLPVLSAGDILLADTTVQRRLWRAERQVLALSTSEDARVSDGTERFGRTWALRALASRAVLSGHVPCVVSQDYLTPGDDPPSDWPSFIDLLSLAMDQTAYELGVDIDTHCAVSRFLLGLGPRPNPMPSELERLQNAPEAPKPHDLARALRLDLLHLLDAVRNRLPETERGQCRLLLLIDDLHRMGDLAAELLDVGLGPMGLRRCRKELRLIFTWARHGQPYQTTIQRIVDWLGDGPAEDRSLDRFADLEERLAYQNFLFHYRQQGQHRPLAVALNDATNGPFIDAFFGELAKRVGGVPSRLKEAEDVIDIYLGLPVNVLVEARDEDVVQQWLDSGDPTP